MTHPKFGKYRCFSPKQFQYLVSLGLLPVETKKHPESGRLYWEFRRNDILDLALTKWTTKTRDA